MKNLVFLTMGDKNFFPTIHYTAQSVRKHYPNASVYVFDIGFEKKQKKELEAIKNVTLIPWELRFANLSFNFRSLRVRLIKIHNLYHVRDFLSCLFHPRKITTNQDAFRFYKKEVMYANKLFCMRHFLKHYGDSFVFLDGDAVPIRPIDELLNSSIDIGVTLKDPSKHNFKHNECSVINAGVSFFLGNRKQNVGFLDDWINQMYLTHEYLAEQTSLVRLIESKAPDILTAPNKTSSIKLSNGTQVKLGTLPYKEYNNYEIEDTGNLPETKIAHFKGGRYKKETFYTLLQRLGLSIY